MSELATAKEYVEYDYSDSGNVTSVQWSAVVSTLDLNSWQEEALKRLLQVTNLPEDWDSYGSTPPSTGVVALSKSLLFNIDNTDYNSLPLPIPNIVPVSGGGIQIEWCVGNRELELEVLPDGSIEFLKAEHEQPINEGEVTSPILSNINRQLAWLRQGQAH